MSIMVKYKQIDSVWRDLLNSIEAPSEIKTLIHKNVNHIVSVNWNGIGYVSKSGRTKMTIRKEDVEPFWDVLSEEGELTIKLLVKHGIYDMERPSRPRWFGAVIFSLLEKLPYVDFDEKHKPRTLYLKRESINFKEGGRYGT